MINLLDQVRHMARGAAILLEWTIDGIVVEQQQAQKRADVCTGRLSGEKCPNNVHYEFNEQVGNAVRRVVALKNRLKLRVHGEKQLLACSACGGCALKAKVWKELSSILPDDDERAKLDPKCWLLTESNE